MFSSFSNCKAVCSNQAYIKQIGRNGGLIWQMSPGPSALEAWSLHTGSWAPVAVQRVELQKKCKTRVPAAEWGARALNAEASTLDVGLTGADYIGGLSREPQWTHPHLSLPLPSPGIKWH